MRGKIERYYTSQKILKFPKKEMGGKMRGKMRGIFTSQKFIQKIFQKKNSEVKNL